MSVRLWAIIVSGLSLSKYTKCYVTNARMSWLVDYTCQNTPNISAPQLFLSIYFIRYPRSDCTIVPQSSQPKIPMPNPSMMPQIEYKNCIKVFSVHWWQISYCDVRVSECLHKFRAFQFSQSFAETIEIDKAETWHMRNNEYGPFVMSQIIW